jgi:hypothetical protein
MDLRTRIFAIALMLASFLTIYAVVESSPFVTVTIGIELVVLAGLLVSIRAQP